MGAFGVKLSNLDNRVYAHVSVPQRRSTHRDIAYVVDTSNSMGLLAGDRTRLKLAVGVLELAARVAAESELTRIAVVAFDYTSRVVLPLQAATAETAAAVAAVAISAYAGADADGADTDIAAGLLKAYTVLSGDDCAPSRHVVLITDGHSRSRQTNAEVVRILREAGVHLHIVACSADASGDLVELASAHITTMYAFVRDAADTLEAVCPLLAALRSGVDCGRIVVDTGNVFDRDLGLCVDDVWFPVYARLGASVTAKLWPGVSGCGEPLASATGVADNMPVAGAETAARVNALDGFLIVVKQLFYDFGHPGVSARAKYNAAVLASHHDGTPGLDTLGRAIINTIVGSEDRCVARACDTRWGKHDLLVLLSALRQWRPADERIPVCKEPELLTARWAEAMGFVRSVADRYRLS